MFDIVYFSKKLVKLMQTLSIIPEKFQMIPTNYIEIMIFHRLFFYEMLFTHVSKIHAIWIGDPHESLFAAYALTTLGKTLEDSGIFYITFSYSLTH